MRGLNFSIIFFSMSVLMGNLWATPEPSDGLYWGWNSTQALGVSSEEFKREMLDAMAYGHKFMRFIGSYPHYQVKLTESDIVVGRVRYDELNGEICVYTILPYAVPKNRIKTVGEFLQQLNEDEELKEFAFGHYYVNPNSGECGFLRRLTSSMQLHSNPSPTGTRSQEIPDHWNDCRLYELHPEIKGLIFSSQTLEQCLKSVKRFPLWKRNKVKLSELRLK